jgi:hypothetical protein
MPADTLTRDTKDGKDTTFQKAPDARLQERGFTKQPSQPSLLSPETVRPAGLVAVAAGAWGSKAA